MRHLPHVADETPSSLSFLQCERKFSLHSFHSFAKYQHYRNVVLRNFFLYLVLCVPTVWYIVVTSYATQSYYIGAFTWGLIANDELPSTDMAEGPTEGPTFSETDSADKWGLWVKGVLLPTFFDASNPNTEYPLGWAGVAGNNMLVGAVRVRQQRGAAVPCPINIGGVDCFSGSLTSAGRDPESALAYAVCDSPDEKMFGDLASKYTSHDCSGFSLSIPSNSSYNDAVTTVDTKILPLMVDFSITRFLVVEYVTYNFAYEIFVYNSHWLEVSISGKLTPGGLPRPFRVEDTSDIVVTSVMMVVVGFLLSLFIVQFIRYGRINGWVLAIRDHFLSVWGVLRLACLSLYIVIFGFTIKLWTLSSQYDDVVVSIQQTAEFPQGLATYAGLYDSVKLLRAITVLLVVLRLLEFGALIPPVFMVTTAISRASRTIFGACVLCAVAVIAFAVGGYVIFGARALGFYNIWASIDSMSRMLVGDYDMDEIRVQGKVIATIFFWSFLICCFFILLNFITAIISGAIEGMEDDDGGSVQALKLRWEYLELWFQSWRRPIPQFGYGPTRMLRIDEYVEEYTLAYGRDPRNFEHNFLWILLGFFKYAFALQPSQNNLELLTAMLHLQPVVDPDLPLEKISRSVRMHDRAPFFQDMFGSYHDFQSFMLRPDTKVLAEQNPSLELPTASSLSEFNYLWFIFIRSSVRVNDEINSHESAIACGLESAWPFSSPPVTQSK